MRDHLMRIRLALHPHRCALTASAVAILSAVVCATPPLQFGWTQTFGDEFDGTSLDNSKWTNPNMNTIINNELQCYTPGQVSVHDGMCWITCVKATCTYGGKTLNYNSGRMDTRGKFQQGYGFYEARFKLPRGKGLWPAFWLYSGLPEIDIMENINQNDFGVFWPAVCYYVPPRYPACGGQPNSGSDWQGGFPQGYTPDLSAAFHEYSCLWTPDSMNFYLDGRKIGHSVKDRIQPNCANMYIILNMAVSQNYGVSDTMLPASFQIDWVRAYRDDGPVQAANPRQALRAPLAATAALYTIRGERIGLRREFRGNRRHDSGVCIAVSHSGAQSVWCAPAP